VTIVALDILFVQQTCDLFVIVNFLVVIFRIVEDVTGREICLCRRLDNIVVD